MFSPKTYEKMMKKMMKKMISQNKQRMQKMIKYAGDTEERRLGANIIFWLERLIIILVVVFPTHLLDLSIPIICASTFHLLFYFVVVSFPNLFSAGPSGIGGIWLFLLDRLTFYMAFEYYSLSAKGFELSFLWQLTVFISLVIHFVYMVEYVLRFLKLVPTSSLPQSDGTSGGEMSKQVEEMKELVNDGKKMMTCMESMIHSDSETRRKERIDMKRYEKIMMTYMDDMICSEIGTLRDNMHLNFDEVMQKIQQVEADVKASKQEIKDVKSMPDQHHEMYRALQEIIKEASATIGESNTRVISGENVEGFTELKEQVRRMELEAETAAEELAREMVKLVRVETVKSARAEIQQWEEDNADYIASLPLLYLPR